MTIRQDGETKDDQRYRARSLPRAKFEADLFRSPERVAQGAGPLDAQPAGGNQRRIEPIRRPKITPSPSFSDEASTCQTVQ